MSDSSSLPQATSRLPLRLRLAVWMAAIFAFIQLSVGFVFLLYEQRNAQVFFDRELQERCALITSEFEGLPTLPTAAHLAEVASAQTRNLIFERFEVMVVDRDGSVVATTATDLPPYTPDPGASFPAQRDVELPGAGALDARLVAMPATLGGELHYVLAIANDAYVENAVHATAMMLLIAIPVGTVATAFCAWFIAGIAVRPLKDLQVIASTIEPNALPDDIDLEDGGEEVVELQTALSDAMSRLEAGYRAQARFIANVSHELKTPIAVTLAEAQSLQLSKFEETTARRFMASTAEEMMRLGRLIESFLTLTRLHETDATPVDLESRPINEIIVESIAHCAPMADQHGVTLHPVLLEDGLETCVYCDADLLRTAVDNLIRNAVRFSPAGERIDVTGRVAERGMVQITVRDRGPGLDTDVIDHVFDRFTQSRDEAIRGRGSGLGLEIAQGIVELHRGEIRVRNLERGCVFEITLRVAGSETEPTDDRS